MVKTMVKKRFVFLFLVLCLSMAISAQAVVIEIDTAQELYDVRNDFDGDYILTADIDLEGFAWRAIGYKDEGKDTGFTGTFDGQNYTISNLTAEDLDGTSSTSAGGNGFKTVSLFGVIGDDGNGATGMFNPGVVKNVGLINPNVKAGDYCGAFVGDLRNGEVSNCFVSGGTVSHETPSSNAGTFGGLIRGDGTITNCWSDAKMILLDGTNSSQGGFMNNAPAEGVTNCYFAGMIEGFIADPRNGGPFRGNGELEALVSCYYDETTTGILDGTVENSPPGLPTAEMMKSFTYVDWDFGYTWTMIPGQTYPKLVGFTGWLSAGEPVPYGGMISTATTELCWTNPTMKASGDPIVGDITCDVYFGTDPNGNLEPPYGLGNLIMGTDLTCVGLPPGSLEANGVYYWTVICHNADAGEIPGVAWPLVTAKTIASSPSPEDGEPGVPRNAQLSWVSGEDEFGGPPDSHLLYMDPNEAYVTARNCGEVAVCVALPPGTTTYDPDLEWGVEYFWAVDEDYGGGEIADGDVWSFTVDPELERGPALAGDFTGNGIVNLEDFAMLAEDWLKCLIINDNCPPGYN